MSFMSFSSQGSPSLPFSSPLVATPPETMPTSCDSQPSTSSDSSNSIPIDLSCVSDMSEDNSPFPCSPDMPRWMSSQPSCMQTLQAETNPVHTRTPDYREIPINTDWDMLPARELPPKRPKRRRTDLLENMYSRKEPQPDPSRFLNSLIRAKEKADKKIRSNAVKRTGSFSSLPSNDASPFQLPLVGDTRRSVKGKEVERYQPMDVDESPPVASTSAGPSTYRHQALETPSRPPDLMEVDSPLAHVRTTKIQRQRDMPPPPVPPPKQAKEPSLIPPAQKQVQKLKGAPSGISTPPPVAKQITLLRANEPPTTSKASTTTPSPGHVPLRTVEVAPEISTPPPAPRSSGPKLHPLLIEQQEEKRKKRFLEIEKATADLAKPAPSVRHKSPSYPPVPANPPPAPVKPTVTPATRRTTPPVLGMRRTNSAPYNNSNPASRPLPTKQQGFKPPLLNKGKPQVKEEKPESKPVAKKESTSTKAASSTKSSAHRRAVSLPAPRSDEPEADPDSSFGDVSIDVDLDALEEVMKQYDGY